MTQVDTNVRAASKESRQVPQMCFLLISSFGKENLYHDKIKKPQAILIVNEN